MTEIATIDWFGRWGTSVFLENTAIFQIFVSFYGKACSSFNYPVVVLFMALQHDLGHFRHCQLTHPHRSWASLLGSLSVLSAHSFTSN